MDRRTALTVAGVSIALPFVSDIPAEGVSVDVVECTKTPLLVVLRHPGGTVVIGDAEVAVRDMAIQVAEAAAVAIYENTGHKVAAVTLPPGYDIEVIEHPPSAKWVTPADMVCVTSVNRRE